MILGKMRKILMIFPHLSPFFLPETNKSSIFTNMQDFNP